MLTGVPETVLEPNILLIKLPEATLKGGVSIAIQGCYLDYWGEVVGLWAVLNFDKFFVADGVWGLPIIESSFSLNVVAFFLAEPARDFDFYVVFNETEIESCNEVTMF